MPYALFSNDAKLSKTYPSEADVWKHARKSGLVVDVVSEEEKAAPRPVLDNDYEIRPCRPEPHEDPARNQAEAEREEALELELGSWPASGCRVPKPYGRSTAAATATPAGTPARRPAPRRLCGGAGPGSRR